MGAFELQCEVVCGGGVDEGWTDPRGLLGASAGLLVSGTVPSGR